MFGFALQNVQPPSETAYGKSDTEILGKRLQVSLVHRVELWEWKAESDFFFFLYTRNIPKRSESSKSEAITVVVYDSARCSCSMYLQSPSSGMSTKAKNESKTKYT